MFREILERVVKNTPGALAGVVMGYDGIPVDSYAPSTMDRTTIEAVGMEFSVIMSQVRTAATMLESGPAQGVTIRTTELTTVVRMLDRSHFAAVALKPTGLAGKARFLLRLEDSRLQEELS